MFSERLRNLWNSQNAGRPIGEGARPRDWFRFENKAAEVPELYIYDAIFPDDGWGGGGVGAAAFQEQLNEIKADDLNLYLNSPGGIVHEGTTIYNALRQHRAKVHVRVMGMAASIASVIAMAGDTIEMSPGSLMMIHKAFGLTIGNDDDHEAAMHALRKMSESIAGIYELRTGKEASHWLSLMKAETWFSDQEAVAAGLADSVVGVVSPSPPKAQREESMPVEDTGAAQRRRLAVAQLEVIYAIAH